MSKKRIVVLSGAGVSAESGLQTFRDNGGLWDKYDPMEVASIEAWHRNPSLVLEFYNVRRAQLKDCRPNEAHRLIAALEEKFSVDVITQNVDNLHERAGSTHLLPLHGQRSKVGPQNRCNEEDRFSEAEVIDVGYDKVELGDLAPNGAQYRPHIVFFGEAVPKIERAIELVEKADIALIVGTSLQVYPAAGLYRYAAPGIPIYIVDPAEVPCFDSRIRHIRKVATEGVKEFVDLLK